MSWWSVAPHPFVRLLTRTLNLSPSSSLSSMTLVSWEELEMEILGRTATGHLPAPRRPLSPTQDGLLIMSDSPCPSPFAAGDAQNSARVDYSQRRRAAASFQQSPLAVRTHRHIPATHSFTAQELYEAGYSPQTAAANAAPLQEPAGGYPGRMQYPSPMPPSSPVSSSQPASAASVAGPTTSPASVAVPPSIPSPTIAPQSDVKKESPSPLKLVVKTAKKRRANGTGGRSAAKRRDDDETSDTEVKSLEEEARVNADIKIPTTGVSEGDKLIAVKYICSSAEFFAAFKLRYAEVFTHISQTLLKDRASYKQVENAWSHIFSKYKACVDREKHTGGGDGDKDRYVKIEKERKRKRGKGEKGGRGKKKKPTVGAFSDAVLDAFEDSDFYPIIDEVARDDPTITKVVSCQSNEDAETDDDDEVRPKKKSKHNTSDSEDELDSAMKVTLASIAKKSKTEARIMSERDKREALDQAVRWIESPNTAIQEMGRTRLAEIQGNGAAAVSALR